MRGTIRATVLCGVVLLAACGRGSDGAREGSRPAEGGTPPAGTSAAAPSAIATPDGEARARAAREAAANWPKVDGRWTQRDVDSKFVAHFDGGQLRYLVEEPASPEAGGGRNEYWFDAGELYYYAGEKPSAYGGTGPGALPQRVPVVAEFRGAEVVRAISREHYGEKKLDDDTVAALRRHAAALAGAAQDEWSARNAR